MEDRHSLISSTNIYWVLSLVPDTVLGAGDTAVNKTDKNPCLQGTYIPVEEDGKQNQKILCRKIDMTMLLRKNKTGKGERQY